MPISAFTHDNYTNMQFDQHVMSQSARSSGRIRQEASRARSGEWLLSNRSPPSSCYYHQPRLASAATLLYPLPKLSLHPSPLPNITMSSCHFCSLAEEMQRAVELGLVAISAVECVPYLQDCDECCARVGDCNEYTVRAPNNDKALAAKNAKWYYYESVTTYGSKSAPTSPYTPSKHREHITQGLHGYHMNAAPPLFRPASSKSSSPAASILLESHVCTFTSKNGSTINSRISTPATSLAPSVSSSFIITQPPHRMHTEHSHSQASVALQSQTASSGPSKSRTNNINDGTFKLDELAKALADIERKFENGDDKDDLGEMVALAKRDGPMLLNPSAAAWTPYHVSRDTHPLVRTMSMTSPYA